MKDRFSFLKQKIYLKATKDDTLDGNLSVAIMTGFALLGRV